MRRRGLLSIAVVLVAAHAGADAGATDAVGPLGLTDCGPAHGVYVCSGLVRTWDGVPLDTTVILPAAEARTRPLVVEVHGFGNSKHEYLDPESTAYTDNAYAWARAGYAVLTYTARGLWGSCGTPESRLASPDGCARGWIHLADVRYEVRDTQELIGRLVDEGHAARKRIAVTGDSYGGGQTLALAALRDRVMLPDGRLVAWRSPAGVPLRIRAAAPVIPWSDLVSAAAPNGRVSATGVTPRDVATAPVGVAKASFVNAILVAAQNATGPGQPVGEPFVPGRPMGFLAPSGADPEADVTAWVARIDAGEPYTDAAAQAVVEQAVSFRSPYYIDPSRRPAALLLASGFTDDLFPVDEALRFANRTRARWPRAPLALLLGDFGHQRASNEPRERDRLLRAIHSWFDHHVRGRGRSPREGVTAFVTTCPRSEPPLGPFFARTFRRLARGTHRYEAPGVRTVASTPGDPVVGLAVDPVTGGGDGCRVTDAAEQAGTARYRVAGPRSRPLTLIGAAKLKAHLTVAEVPEGVAQLAARLWDVAPDGSQTLVARGSYRPADGANAWQLHPAAWQFEPGHAAELELLGADAPYSRPSNGAFQVEIDDLRVTLPVRQRRAG